jgi:outer membrane usher protein FimD/PapC
MSIPLEKLFGGHPTYASYMMNTSKQGNTTNNLSLGGTLLADNNLSWSVMQGYGSQGQGSNSGINADWRASYARPSSATPAIATANALTMVCRAGSWRIATASPLASPSAKRWR